MKMKKKSSQSMAQERTADQLPFRIPPILLEGDELGAPTPAMGPGEKYVLGPAAPAGPFDIQAARLPEAYGTRTLLLTARDPHWLYAHWDVAREEQRQYSAPAAGQHLVLRVYERAVSGSPAAQIHLHPDSRHWSVYVPRAETQYVAEVGCSLPGGLWQKLATSQVATTPPDTVSQDNRVQFATIESLAAAPRPPELPPSTPQANRQTSPGEPAQGPEQAPVVSPHALPPTQYPAASQDTARQQVAAEAGLWQDRAGSAEIAELLQPRATEEHGLPSPLAAVAGITSPSGQPWIMAAPAGAGQEPPDKFWFNINAELVLYGATEPDAQVAIAGQPIRLRPDGTFNYRFALPDGDYDLVATAISAHNDRRQVRLQFSRRTEGA
jgi:hypothetical protein